MVGHSRGGYIVAAVAKRLKEKPCICGPINISFMGLYDAVDMTPHGDTDTVASNVKIVAHARRDPRVFSRPSFGNTATSGGMKYEQRFFWVTHSGAGGDPWGAIIHFFIQPKLDYLLRCPDQPSRRSKMLKARRRWIYGLEIVHAEVE